MAEGWNHSFLNAAGAALDRSAIAWLDASLCQALREHCQSVGERFV